MLKRWSEQDNSIVRSRWKLQHKWFCQGSYWWVIFLFRQRIAKLCDRSCASSACENCGNLASFMRFEYRRLKADCEREPRFWIEEPTGPPMMRAYLSVHGADLLWLAEEVFKWVSEPGTVVCRFEDLLGDNGAASQQQAAENIAAALGL